MNQGESRIEYSRRNAAAMKEKLGIQDLGPEGIDLVVDASGAEVSIQTGILIAKAGGTYVQVGLYTLHINRSSYLPRFEVGMGSPEVVIPITLLLTKEVKFLSSFRYGVRLELCLSTFCTAHVCTISLVTTSSRLPSLRPARLT
jgi:D-xylulose reductase